MMLQVVTVLRNGSIVFLIYGKNSTHSSDAHEAHKGFVFNPHGLTIQVFCFAKGIVIYNL